MGGGQLTVQETPGILRLGSAFIVVPEPQRKLHEPL